MGESSGSIYHNPPSRCSTAYNGSAGYINDSSAASIDLSRDTFDDLQLPAPTKTATPIRPALGSRLLSTLSNAQPAAAALSRKGSILHSRAKSLAGFVPRLNTSTATTTTTPDRSQPQQKPHPVFGDLFNGDSAPVRLGITPSSPTKEESEFIMEYKPIFTERPGGGPRRRSTAQTHLSPPSTATKSGGWFSRKPTLPTPPTPTTRPQDEILAIEINASLFPNGPADSLSPHAFNELLLNATHLLQRMQAAYKEKVDYISTIQPEIDAQKEEVEEAETRSRHLKLQLEDISRQAADQNQALQEMAIQLAEEKMKVSEAQEAARSTVKLVRRTTDQSTDGDDEDTPRRRKRGSPGRQSGSQASDSGFESDAEYAESVMSAGAETPLSPPTMTITPAYDGRDWAINTSKSRPALSRQSSRSVVSGTTAYSSNTKRLGSEGAAWATVESLRGENQGLQRQMEEMQKTLQGCIDFVGNVKS
ncbi:hypothetical protein LTR36_008432 [Oleoguttula mirabilis]|uniref:Uncharacterized protein n=1 Tax=Oleoguttula mirabilis TaxID=1507867 RepID=A0AAV9J7B4_9PEZI|nr:hypothetical protein LTR36_008432 [Oleoguttula mirabilis]